MILVLDLKRQGLQKNWENYGFTHNGRIEVLDLMPGGVLSNMKRLNKVSQLLPQTEVLFIFALRPIELFILSILSKNTQVILIQHGIFVPKMKREVGGMFRKSKEVVLYLISLWKLGALNWSSFAWILGRKEFRQTGLYHLASRVDKILVYSEYWQNYFQENFGVQGSFRYVGNPDSILYSDKTIKVDGLVYVAQTLIEDSRLSKSDWKRFIMQLNDYILNNNIPELHIKLHPRTDKSIFNEIDDRIPITYYLSDLPESSMILGHYSTLLGLYWLRGHEVLIYEFKGHKTPEFMPRYRTSDFVEYFYTYNTNSVAYYYGKELSTYSIEIQNILDDNTWS